MSDNINTVELIQRFRSFCGVEKYRKFLRSVNTNAIYKGRLLYWQEQLWDDFCSQHEEYREFTWETLLDVFRICDVHEQRLLSDEVPAIYGHWVHPDEYFAACEASFPYANMMYCGDSVERQRHANQHVKYCPACRDALNVWNSNRRQKIGTP